MHTEAVLMRVAAGSRTTAVAGAIAALIREGKQVTIQVIGAGAVNQAVKAIAIAQRYLEGDGIGLSCTPTFTDLVLEKGERTAMRLLVAKHAVPPGSGS